VLLYFFPLQQKLHILKLFIMTTFLFIRNLGKLLVSLVSLNAFKTLFNNAFSQKAWLFLFCLLITGNMNAQCPNGIEASPIVNESACSWSRGGSGNFDGACGTTFAISHGSTTDPMYLYKSVTLQAGDYIFGASSGGIKFISTDTYLNGRLTANATTGLITVPITGTYIVGITGGVGLWWVPNIPSTVRLEKCVAASSSGNTGENDNNNNSNGIANYDDLILGSGDKQFIFHTQMQNPNDPPVIYIAPKKSGSDDFDWNNQITFKHDGSIGIGSVPLPNTKLCLYNNIISTGTNIYGLQSHMEVIGSSPLYGAYFKNKRTGGMGSFGLSYGIYVDNEISTFSNFTYGVYVNNTGSSYGGRLHGFYAKNIGIGNERILHGLYVDNINSSGRGETYGAYLNNIRDIGEGDVYGIHTFNSSADPTGSVYGIHSTVSGGHDDNRYAGYFTGGKVVVMDGSVGIGCEPGDVPFRVRNTTFPNFVFEGISSRLEIGVAMTDGCFAPYAQAGDIVYRPLGKHGLIFELPSSVPNGDAYIKFGDYANGGWFSIYNNRTVQIDGKVGIGTTAPEYDLDVNGTIRAREVLVNIEFGADFVFEENYALRSLNEVHSFIQANKHLPEIPSAAEMVSNGLDMGEFQIKLLQKIEELTLYIIEQDQRIKELEKNAK